MATVSFALEGDAWSLPLSAVESVLQAAWPVPVPRAPFGCLGLLDLRGERVPLVDTSALFARRRPLRPEADPQSLLGKHVLIVNAPLRAALLVDRVLEVQEGDEAGTPVDLPALLGGARGRLLSRLVEGHGR